MKELWRSDLMRGLYMQHFNFYDVISCVMITVVSLSFSLRLFFPRLSRGAWGIRPTGNRGQLINEQGLQSPGRLDNNDLRQ